MSAGSSKPDRDKERDGMRPSSPSSEDLREYLPPRGAAGDALMDAAMAPPTQRPDPVLVEKLRRMNAEEEAKPVTKPVHVKAAPRARRAAPPLKVVVGAVLAVVVPMLAMAALIEHMVEQKTDKKIAAAMASTRGGATATMGAAETAAAPGAASRAGALPDASAAAMPSATASAGPSQPIKPHGKPHAPGDDPYEGMVPAPRKTAEPAAPPAPSGTSPPDVGSAEPQPLPKFIR